MVLVRSLDASKCAAPSSPSVKQLVRAGIPPHMRPRCWFAFSGASALAAAEPGLYTLLCFRELMDLRQGYCRASNPIIDFVYAIDRDIYRTFPDNPLFRHRPAEPAVPGPARAAAAAAAPLTPDVASASAPDPLSLRRFDLPAAYGTIAGSLSSLNTIPVDISHAQYYRGSSSTRSTDSASTCYSSRDSSSSQTYPTKSTATPHWLPESQPPSPARSTTSDDSGTSKITASDPALTSLPPIYRQKSTLCQSSPDLAKLASSPSALPLSQSPIPTHADPCITNETNPYILSLRRILVAFAYYSWPHPDESRAPSRSCSYAIGYCQSLNFIVGFLLIIFTESDTDIRAAFDLGHDHSHDTSTAAALDEVRMSVESRVFWILVAIVEHRMPPEMYGRTLQGSRIQQEVLWTWIIRHNGPKLGLERLASWASRVHAESALSPPPQRRFGLSQLFPTSTAPSRSASLPAATENGHRSSSSLPNHISLAPAPSTPSAFGHIRNLSTNLRDLERRVGTISQTPALSLVTTPWFMTLFVNFLPTESVLRIWDCFLYQGEKILFRVALALMIANEEALVKCTDFADAWVVLRGLPKQPHDLDDMLGLCFSQGHAVDVEMPPQRDSCNTVVASGDVALDAFVDPHRSVSNSSSSSSSSRSSSPEAPLIQASPVAHTHHMHVNTTMSDADRQVDATATTRGISGLRQKTVDHYRSIVIEQNKECRHHIHSHDHHHTLSEHDISHQRLHPSHTAQSNTPPNHALYPYTSHPQQPVSTSPLQHKHDTSNTHPHRHPHTHQYQHHAHAQPPPPNHHRLHPPLSSACVS